jgi:hypothetical protein
MKGWGVPGRKQRKCTLSRHRPLTIAVGKRAATPRTASRICTGGIQRRMSNKTTHCKKKNQSTLCLFFSLTSSVMTALSGSSTIGDSVPS